MNIEKLKSLTKTDFTHFIPSENNVKYKIVIPFLQAFNHENLDLEHAAQGSRIDINIGNRIIVETKALGVNLENCVLQLSNYSGRELPILAILTNGRNFRIYSPQWRQLRTFSEKLIYKFELHELNNDALVNRLEKILAFKNYESDEFISHIEEREREILEAGKKIDELKKSQSEQLRELTSEIDGLKNQLHEISERIKEKEKKILDIQNNKFPEVDEIIREQLLPIKKLEIERSIFSNQHNNPNKNQTQQVEIEKVKKRVPKWLVSPNQANHKILVAFLKLLGIENSVSLAELQKSCSAIENFGTHYTAMKSISERNHGKVFEENNKQIFLWEPVKDFIIAEYNKFMKH